MEPRDYGRPLAAIARSIVLALVIVGVSVAGLPWPGQGWGLSEAQAKRRKKKRKKKPRLTPEDKKASEVLDLIKQGNVYYDAGKYEQALEVYERAYAKYPDTALVYRLGQTAEALERYEEAIGYYETFRKAQPMDKLAQRLEDTKIPELRGKLPAKITIVSTPEGARIYLESTENPPIGETPFEGEIPSGTTTIVLVAEGYEEMTQEVILSREEINSYTITMKEERLEDEDDAGAVAGSIDDEGSTLTTLSWVTLGLGAALLGTGAVFTVLQNGRTDEVNSYEKRAPGASRGELDELKESANSLHTTALILYITGGVIAAAGTGLLIASALGSETPSVNEDEDQSELGLELSPTQGGAYMGLRLRF